MPSCNASIIQMTMKELKINDKNGDGAISIAYQCRDFGYLVCVEIRKSIFCIHTEFSLANSDIELLLSKVSTFKQMEQGEMAWANNDAENSLSVSLSRYCGNIEAALQVADKNHKGNISMAFDCSSLDLLEFVDVENDSLFQCDNTDVFMSVNNTKREADSLDFNFIFRDYFIEINKDFWLYNFEHESLCSQFADFINSGKDFSMNVMDSFMWIDFKIRNGIYCVTIDVFDLERNQSNVKLTSQIEKEKVEAFYRQFVS